MSSKEDIPMDERVRLMNLFYPEMGIRIRAKKHLTIGYTFELVWDFVYRAYELGKQQAAAQVRAEEREACAQVADNLGRDAKELNRARGGGWEDYPTAAMLIAQRIRAREQAG